MSKVSPIMLAVMLFLQWNQATAAESDDVKFLHIYPPVGMAQMQLNFRSGRECELNLKNGYSQIKDKTAKCESDDLSEMLIFFVKMIKPMNSTDPDEIRFSSPQACDSLRKQVLDVGKNEDIDFKYYCGNRM